MSNTSAPPEGNAESGESAISHNDCFDLLSNHRRRYVLHYLQGNGEEASLGELADTIAAWENGVDPDEVSYDERKRVYTSLQQVHLPRMDDLGVVEFDDRAGVVEPGPAAADLDVDLEVVHSRDVPWSLFYTGGAVLNAVLVAGALAGIPPLSAVSPLGWAVFVLTTFLVSSFVHLYLTRTEMRLGATERPPGTGGD
jgi:predicted transcriptional regulator